MAKAGGGEFSFLEQFLPVEALSFLESVMNASDTRNSLNGTHSSYFTKAFPATSWPLELELSEWCMIFLPIALYWIYSTFLYTLSLLKLTTLELHRIPTNQSMRPPNRVTVSKVLLAVFVQHVVQAVVACVLVYWTRPEDMSQRTIEPIWLMIAKLVAGAIMIDTYQYWVHRAMHVNKFLYRNFHSVHHQLTVPFAYGALYNHPVEGFLLDTVGGAIPTALMDMHPWTATILYSVATLKTVDDHCGYAWPWDPFHTLFPNNASYHDVHHWGKGRLYNFSQ
ncbi:hypothetical protein HK102_010681, partial [Quaeritorhiza haematococci]